MVEFDQSTQESHQGLLYRDLVQEPRPAGDQQDRCGGPAANLCGRSALVQHSLRRLLTFVIVSSLLLSAGCKGCFESKPEGEKPKEEEKVKENFEAQTPVTLPGFYPIDPAEKKKLEKEAKDDEKKRALLQRMDPAIRFNQTKLGHWISVDFLAIANNFNADGYLQTTTLEQGQPALINGTDYFVQTSRPVNLVKGDWKKLETSVFLPRRPDKANVTSINYSIKQWRKLAGDQPDSSAQRAGGLSVSHGVAVESAGYAEVPFISRLHSTPAGRFGFQRSAAIL